MYLEPSDKKLSLRDRRSRFLTALNAFAPSVRESLIDNILPRFRSSSGSPSFRKKISVIIENDALVTKLSDGDSVFAGFLECLLEWQGHWHLLDHWFQSVALKTVVQIFDFPDLKHDGWSMPGEIFWPPLDLKSHLTVAISAWNPLGPLSENQHEKSEIDRLNDVLKSLNEANLTAYQNAGWRRVPKPIPDAHFEWLIDFQIYGLGPTKIAKRKLGIRRRTLKNETALEREAEKIKKAIERLSTSIGLTRRKLRTNNRD